MGLGIGIVGLPNVGKSTLFNALTRAQHAESANYPFVRLNRIKRLFRFRIIDWINWLPWQHRVNDLCYG